MFASNRESEDGLAFAAAIKSSWGLGPINEIDEIDQCGPSEKAGLRVLTLCYEFPPLGGGGSKVARGLASRLVEDGHSVDMVTTRSRGLPSSEQVSGIDVWRVSALRRRPDVSNALELATYLLPSLFRAIRLVRSQKPDVVHAHFILPDGVVAWMLRRLTGKRYIITAHGSDVPGFNPDRFQLAHRLLQPLWHRVVRDADAIICPSSTLQVLLSTHRPSASTQVIPNGFDTERFRIDDPREKTTELLCVSRLLERKGLQHMLAAVARIDVDQRPAMVHVVGDGPYAAALRQQAAELGLDVAFHGWLDNDSPELEALFSRCGIFALPSSSENFPISLLEAMSSSSAIITTAGGGCEDVVGSAAMLTDYGDVDALADAIGRLVRDTETRCRLGTKARARMRERFGWDAVVRQYLAAYLDHPADPAITARTKATLEILPRAANAAAKDDVGGRVAAVARQPVRRSAR